MKNHWLLLAVVTELAFMFIIYTQVRENISLERKNIILESEVEILLKFKPDTVKDTVYIQNHTTIVNKPERVIYKGYDPIIRSMPYYPYLYQNDINNVPDSIFVHLKSIPL